MPYTVTHLSRAYGVSGNTIRNWSEEFADHLSEQAAPEGKGETRFYTEEDAAVLETIAVLRSQNQPYGEVRRRLEEGERLEFVEPPEGERESNEAAEGSPVSRSTELAPMALVEKFIEQFEGQIALLQSERDRLTVQLEEAQAARVEAEKRASKLEGQIEAITAQAHQETALEAKIAALEEQITALQQEEARPIDEAPQERDQTAIGAGSESEEAPAPTDEETPGRASWRRRLGRWIAGGE